VHLKVFRTQMTLSCEQHLNVLRSRIEYGREVARRHVYGLISDVDKISMEGDHRIGVDVEMW